MSYSHKKQSRLSVLVLLLILAVVMTTTAISSAVTAYGMTEDYWQVKLGEDTIALVKTEDEANAMIQMVKDHYTNDGMDLRSVSIEPAMTVEVMSVPAREEQPELTADTRAVVNELLEGEGVDTTYVVQDGDTLWDVANAFGTDVDTILEKNPGMTEDLQTGDVILFSQKSCRITVTTEEEIVGEEAIEYETVYKETDDLYEGEEKVKKHGENGIRCYTAIEVRENGQLVSREEIDSREVKAPVDEVILKGTKVKEEEKEEEPEVIETVEDATYEEPAAEETYVEESYEEPAAEETYEEPAAEEPVEETYEEPAATYSGDLQETVLNAAYSQLGVGQDCTSLVTNSLAAAGIYFHGWPQQYASLGEWTSNPVPGDIIIYDTHVAVYAGGSSAVHGGWNGGTTAVGPVYCSAGLIGYIHIG